MHLDEKVARFLELSGVSGEEAAATASTFLTLAEGDVGGALDLFFDSFQGVPDVVPLVRADSRQQNVATIMNCSFTEVEEHISALVLKTNNVCTYDEACSLLAETGSVDDSFDLWINRRLLEFQREFTNHGNQPDNWSRIEARKADEIDHNMKHHFALTRNEKGCNLSKEKLLLHQLTELMSDHPDFLTTIVATFMPTIVLARRRDDDGNLMYPLQHNGRRGQASEEVWEAEQEYFRHILNRERFDQANWETLLNSKQMLEEALVSTIVLWVGSFIESGKTPPTDTELLSTFVQDRTGLAFATEAAVFQFLGREPAWDPPPLGSLERTESSELVRVRLKLPSWEPRERDKRRCCRSDHMAAVFRVAVPSSRAGRILHLERDFQMHGVAVQKPDGKVQYLSNPQAITVQSGDWLWFGFIDSRCALWHEQCCSFLGDDASSEIGIARLPLYEIEMPDDPKWRGKTVADLQECGINILGLLLPNNQQQEAIWHPAGAAGIETGSRMLVLPSQVSKLSSELGFQGVRVVQPVVEGPTTTRATASQHVAAPAHQPLLRVAHSHGQQARAALSQRRGFLVVCPDSCCACSMM